MSGPGPEFDSGELGPGERFEQKVDDRGVVEYMCTIHPEEMQGAFKVVGGLTPPPSPRSSVCYSRGMERAMGEGGDRWPRP